MKLNEHANNFNTIQEKLHCGNLRRISQSLKQEKFLRKREVTISMINIYIVIIMVSCHSVRIIPNLYEIYSFFLFGENKHWPNWVYLVTTISHFALAVSCSANFYIYYYNHKHNRSSQEREMTVTSSSVDGGVSETRFDGQKKIKTKAKFLNGQKKFIRRQQTKTLNEGE